MEQRCLRLEKNELLSIITDHHKGYWIVSGIQNCQYLGDGTFVRNISLPSGISGRNAGQDDSELHSGAPSGNGGKRP